MSYKGSVILSCDNCNNIIKGIPVITFHLMTSYLYEYEHYCSIKCFLNSPITKKQFEKEMLK